MTFTEEQKERIEALMHECVENADYKTMKKILKSGYSMYAGRKYKSVQQLKQLVIVLADKLLTKFYEANERLDLPFQGKLEENTHEVTLKLFAQGYEETNEYINGLRVEISLQMEITKVFEMPDDNGKYHVSKTKSNTRNFTERIDMEPKKYYKLNITDKDNKQQFCPENFKSIESAKEYFKTIEHLAKSACIMLYRNDLNVCNWFWGAEYKNWI